MLKAKSEGDLHPKKDSPRMETSASVGKLIRSREALEVLEEAPGEEDSETSPSRDKRDTILSKPEELMMKSVPIGEKPLDEEDKEEDDEARK